MLWRDHWKIWFLGGGWGEGSRETNIWGELPKKGGAWTVYRFKRGLGKKEVGDDTPVHTMDNDDDSDNDDDEVLYYVNLMWVLLYVKTIFEFFSLILLSKEVSFKLIEYC